MDLRGRTSTGGEALAPLANDDTFMTACVAGYGSGVAWADDEHGGFSAATLIISAHSQAFQYAFPSG